MSLNHLEARDFNLRYCVLLTFLHTLFNSLYVSEEVLLLHLELVFDKWQARGREIVGCFDPVNYGGVDSGFANEVRYLKVASESGGHDFFFEPCLAPSCGFGIDIDSFRDFFQRIAY